MPKRHNEHLNLADVLKEFVAEHNLQKGLDQVEVERIWAEQMGPGIQKYTSSLKLQKNTLYIQLSSSVLREELSYGKEKIIKILNEALGREVIGKIVLR